MATVTSAMIHPTAIVSPECELADDVEIGPYVVIEGPVRLGPGCVIKPYVHLIGPLVMGAENQVFSGAVIGERPQHTGYHGEPTSVEIGDRNIFREHVTVHRGTTDRYVTRIGSGNFLMAGSHIAHDCIVGDRCVLANGALVGGHAILDDGCFLSGNAAVHQRCRVGRLAMLGGVSGSSKDIPPFITQQGINGVTGLNIVGLRRAGISREAIAALKTAFHHVFQSGLVLEESLRRTEADVGDVAEVREFVSFIRNSVNGINAGRMGERGAKI